jgi:hypothetical protein
MKKGHKPKRTAEMLPEYNFRGGVRGKYARRFAAGSNFVVLSPKIAKAFPNSEAVNKALAKLIRPALPRNKAKTLERKPPKNRPAAKGVSFRRKRRINF